MPYIIALDLEIKTKNCRHDFGQIQRAIGKASFGLGGEGNYR